MNLFAISLILSLICGINAYENGRGFRTSAVRNLRAEPTNLRAYVGAEGSGSSSSSSDFGLSFGSSGSGASRGAAESSSGFSITTQSDGGERIRAEAEAAGKEFGNAIKSTITGGLGLFTKAIENTAKAATADVSFRSSAASSHSKGGGSTIATGSSNTGRNNIELNFNSRSDIRDRANSNINTKTKIQSDSGIGIRVQPKPIMCSSGITQVDFGVRSDRDREHEDSYSDREAVLNAAGGAESELNNKFSYGISGHADSHQKSAVQKPGGIPFGLNIKSNIDDNPEATRTSTSGFSFEANSRSNLNSRKIDSDADNGDSGRGKITAGFTAGSGGGSDTRSSSSIGFQTNSRSNLNARKVDSAEDGGHGKISLGFKTSGAKTSHERSSSLGFETSSRHHNSGNIESNAETRNNAAVKSSIGSEFSLGLGGRSKSRVESDLEDDDAGKFSSGFKTSGGSSGGSRSEFGISIGSGSRSRGSISSDGEDDNGNSERANFAAGFMNKGRSDDDDDVELKGRTNGKFGSSIETSGKTRGSSDFSIGIGSVSDLASRMGAMGGISLSTGSNFGEEENTDTSTRGAGSAGFSYLRSPSRRNYRRLRLSSPPSLQFPYRRHRSSVVIQ